MHTPVFEILHSLNVLAHTYVLYVYLHMCVKFKLSCTIRTYTDTFVYNVLPHMLYAFDCRLEKISNDNSSLLSQLTKANENYKSMVAQKDLELKNFQERYSSIYVYVYVFVCPCACV